MKMAYKGDWSPNTQYRRGDVVKIGHRFQVLGARGFVDTSVPVDISCVGPPGIDGADGRDSNKPGPRGIDGADGQRGERGADGRSISPRGNYRVGETYQPLDVVTFNGSSWLATTETMRRPGRSPDWQLLASRGADGIGQRGAKGEDGTGGGSLTPQAAIFTSEAYSGFAVYVVSDTHVDNAQADDIATAEVAGLAIAHVAPGAAGQYLTEGTLTLEDWSHATGAGANLSPGAAYFLSTELPGRITATPPTSPSTNVAAMIGRALNYRTLDISIGLLVQLSEYEEET